MDKEILFKPLVEEAEVDIPGRGTVRVRGLTRVEVLSVRKATDDEHLDGPRILTLERKMLALALVDPKLSEAEVGRWQSVAAAGELDPVSTKVQELSGLLEGAPKSGVPAVGSEPGD